VGGFRVRFVKRVGNGAQSLTMYAKRIQRENLKVWEGVDGMGRDDSGVYLLGGGEDRSARGDVNERKGGGSWCGVSLVGIRLVKKGCCFIGEGENEGECVAGFRVLENHAGK